MGSEPEKSTFATPPRRRWRARLLLPLAAIAPLAACGGGPGGDGSDDPTAVREIRLSPEPLFSIGVVGGDPDYELFEVWGAVRLESGRTVVANRGTFELRYYDAEGRHLRTVGREGEGPGEFDDVRYLGAIRGDTVVAYDYMMRRVSWWDGQGEFVRSASVDLSSGTVRMFGSSGPAQPLSVLARHDGTLIGQPALPIWLGRQSPPSDGIHRAELPLFALGDDGAVSESIGPFPGPEFFVHEGRGNGRVGGPGFHVAPGREHVFVGSGLEYGFAVVGDGGSVDTVSLSWPRRAYTEEYWQSQIDWAYEFFGEQESVRELRNAMPKPDSLPAYSRLLADSDDRVWLGMYRELAGHLGTDPTEWLVVTHEGRLLGTLTTPDGLEVTHVGHGVLTGVVTNELGVEQVQAYRILDPF